MFLNVYFRNHPPHRLPLWQQGKAFPAEGSDAPSVRVISGEQVRAEERSLEAVAKAGEVDVGGREAGEGNGGLCPYLSCTEQRSMWSCVLPGGWVLKLT